MKNEYQCTYCTRTECTISIKSSHNVQAPPECIYHEGETAEWVVVEAGVDDLKRLMAEEIYRVNHDHGVRFSINTVNKAKQYLEGLEG